MEVSAAKKLLLLLVSTLTVMAGAIITPSLPGIREFFRGTEHVEVFVPLILTMPALSIALMAPISGWFIDNIGRKPVLLVSLVVFALAGSSGLYLDSLPYLLVSRAVLGFGVAGIMTVVTTLIADYFSGDQRASFMGQQASFMALGGVVFLTGGGWLADHSWRFPFAIYLVSFTLVAPAWFAIKEPRKPERKKNLEIGAERPKSGWGVVILIYIVGFLGMSIFFTIPVHLPFFLKNFEGLSALHTGLAIACATLTASISSYHYRRFRKYLSFQGIAALMYLTVGVAFFALSRVSSYEVILPIMLFGGIGFGLNMPNVNVWLTDHAPAGSRGRLIGGLTTSVFLGQFLVPVITGPVVESQGYLGPQGLFGMTSLASISIGLAFAFYVVLRRRWKNKAGFATANIGK